VWYFFLSRGIFRVLGKSVLVLRLGFVVLDQDPNLTTVGRRRVSTMSLMTRPFSGLQAG
jgi:hypothetical protein